jgi:hypothetical protein
MGDPRRHLAHRRRLRPPLHLRPGGPVNASEWDILDGLCVATVIVIVALLIVAARSSHDRDRWR